jgi:hypothetical protein
MKRGENGRDDMQKWKHNKRNSKNRIKNKRKRRRIKCRRGTR